MHRKELRVHWRRLGQPFAARCGAGKGDFVAALLFAANRLDFTELFEAAVAFAGDALFVHADRSQGPDR